MASLLTLDVKGGKNRPIKANKKAITFFFLKILDYVNPTNVTEVDVWIGQILNALQ